MPTKWRNRGKGFVINSFMDAEARRSQLENAGKFNYNKSKRGYRGNTAMKIFCMNSTGI